MQREKTEPRAGNARPRDDVRRDGSTYIPTGFGGPIADAAILSRLDAFRDDAGGVLDFYFVRQGDEAVEVLTLASLGHPVACGLFNAIRCWFGNGATTTKRRHCLTCGAEFDGARPPAGFAFLVPHRPDPREIICAPMCRRCCARSNDGTLKAAMEALRGVWSDLREVAITGDGGDA